MAGSGITASKPNMHELTAFVNVATAHNVVVNRTHSPSFRGEEDA